MTLLTLELMFLLLSTDTILHREPDIITTIAQGDARQAAEALAMLWNNEQLLLETVPALLPHIIDYPEEFDYELFQQKRKKLPHWRVVSAAPYNLEHGDSRKETVLSWVCAAIREASISPERDNLRKMFLGYLEEKAEFGPIRYKWVENLYFWNNIDIEPDSDCSELLSFIDRELANQQTTSSLENLIDPLGKYIRTKVDPKEWKEWVSKYKPYFPLRRIAILDGLVLTERFGLMSEVHLKSMDKMTPEELLKMKDTSSTAHAMTVRLLAGTRLLRKQNFYLLLPILEDTNVGRSRFKDFIYYYANAIPADAADEEKHQQDRVLDIIEKSIREKEFHDASDIDILEAFLRYYGSPIIPGTYAEKRVVAIIKNYCNNLQDSPRDRYILQRAEEILYRIENKEDCGISTAPTVVSMITIEDASQAAEGLAMLCNDEELLYENVLTLLPFLKDCPDEFDDALFERKRKPLPEWRGENSLPAEWRNKPRRDIVLQWVCNAIREAPITPQRDCVRRTVLTYLENELDFSVHQRYEWAKALYFWNDWIEPESDCLELLAFLDRTLAKEKDINENESIFRLLWSYIQMKVPQQEWPGWIEEYQRYFAPGVLEMRMVTEQYSLLSEAQLKSLDKISPEELLQSMDYPLTYGTTKDSKIATLLAGTRQARKDNFKLLLPILEQTTRTKSRNFLDRYAAPIPADAPDEEKEQQDIVIRIIEEKELHSSSSPSVSLLWQLVARDNNVMPDAYAIERVKEILSQYSTDDRLYNDLLQANEAEIHLRRIEESETQ